MIHFPHDRFHKAVCQHGFGGTMVLWGSLGRRKWRILTLVEEGRPPLPLPSLCLSLAGFPSCSSPRICGVSSVRKRLTGMDMNSDYPLLRRFLVALTKLRKNPSTLSCVSWPHAHCWSIGQARQLFSATALVSRWPSLQQIIRVFERFGTATATHFCSCVPTNLPIATCPPGLRLP